VYSSSCSSSRRSSTTVQSFFFNFSISRLFQHKYHKNDGPQSCRQKKKNETLDFLLLFLEVAIEKKGGRRTSFPLSLYFCSSFLLFFLFSLAADISFKEIVFIFDCLVISISVSFSLSLSLSLSRWQSLSPTHKQQHSLSLSFFFFSFSHL